MSEDDPIEPVNRQSTAAIIADQLRTVIMRGTFEPGAQLAEADLAGRLGVSRGSLREAMQRLVQEGLLHGERHRGLFVVELTEADVRDIYAARLAVERAACLRILDEQPSDAIPMLDAALDEIIDSAGDPVAVADADHTFHSTLVAASGSPRLQRMAATLLVETRMCLTAMQENAPAPADLIAEHREFLDALRDGDRERLLATLESHMSDAVSRIVNVDRGPQRPDAAIAG